MSSISEPSCFCGYGDGRFYISGNENGSLCVWDLTKLDQGIQKGNSIVLEPTFSSEKNPNNHRRKIVNVTVFGRKGSNAICALDRNSEVSFWYIRNENDKIELVFSEKKRLNQWNLPSYSLTVSPTSVNSYLVGCGNLILNCSRFGSQTFPNRYTTNSSVTHLEFSPILSSLFLACCDNGSIAIFDVSESNPLLILQIELDSTQICATWSPTRSSVIFAANKTGTRLSVFDLSKDLRKPVYLQSIGSSVQEISSVLLSTGVVIATGEGSGHFSIIRVGKDYSAELKSKEQKEFLRQLYSS